MYGTCQVQYSEQDYAGAITRWAKMELLKEKVKQRMDAKYGKQLDQIADLMVDMLEERKKSSHELDAKQDQLEDAFESLYIEGSEEE